MIARTKWIASPAYHWLWAGIYTVWKRLAPKSYDRDTARQMAALSRTQEDADV